MSMSDPAISQVKAMARSCADRGLSLAEARHLFEVVYIADAYVRAGGNRSKAAKSLKADRITLHRTMRGGRTFAKSGQENDR